MLLYASSSCASSSYNSSIYAYSCYASLYFLFLWLFIRLLHLTLLQFLLLQLILLYTSSSYDYLYIFFFLCFFCRSRSSTFWWTHCHRFPMVFLVNWSGGSHRVIICAGIHYNGLTSTLNPSTNLTSPQIRVRELNCTSHFSHQGPFFCGSTGGIAH